MGELLKILPRYEFEKLEKQHRSNHYTKYYTGWQQLVTLLYSQIAGHDSLRAIQTSLGVHSKHSTEINSVVRQGTTLNSHKPQI